MNETGLLSETKVRFFPGQTDRSPDYTIRHYSGGDPAWDINQDGKVDYEDLAILGVHCREGY
jgi:hypothetical protein